MYKVGIDVGSTTLKVVVLNNDDKIIFCSYKRHFSQIVSATISMLTDLLPLLGEHEIQVAISGSAGMGLAESAGLEFTQEVYATKIAAGTYNKDTDVIIELGGEDAKILFLSGSLEVRMNGSCAGGTGAFIDQMATLLGLGMEDVDTLSSKATEIYTIASRCGVFAKTDIQPLINQGAKPENLIASILVAVVNQTIAGLAQGRKIEGNVLYLGGPLTFISTLRKYFDEALHTKGTCPDNSLYYVALGAALTASQKPTTLTELIKKIQSYKGLNIVNKLPPLFVNEEEYRVFKERHEKATVECADPNTYIGNAYLGIDSGSTTIKLCLLTEDGKLLLSRYQPNNGNPIQAVKSFLNSFYETYPLIKIAGAASTGYGEELIKTAFNLDYSLVETQAHFIGAKFFSPDVDFIIDIGGQDIKCFKIENGAISDIFLNEACSSGCGSFLQTFANALGQSVSDFSHLAISASAPVDLGSRCTVFMNSQVKQAQKNGATINDISAGLAISVVKNALYKVIRTSSASSLGKHIIVQGGTFHNEAVLRAFEKEIGQNVTCPTISGLMGAYGAALYVKSKRIKSSTITTKEEVENLQYSVKNIRCQGCPNHCLLTINTFANNRRFISGNRCEKPTGKKVALRKEDYNLVAFKQQLLTQFIEKRNPSATRGTIGIPMVLNMFELLPFYHTLLTELGFDVITSPFSTRELYIKGQNSIPSDTACFPAKLVHGHIEYLVENKVDKIFYPSMTFNLNENKGDNHFNCPVVAYYPQLINANQDMNGIPFIHGFLGFDNKKTLIKRIAEMLSVPKKEVKSAVEEGFKALDYYHRAIYEKGDEIIKKARENGIKIITLAGRPYHIDPEVNHSIDNLITSLGSAVITEDVFAKREGKNKTGVLNQWTYHARLYDAAYFIRDPKDMELVQLVSFGCGLDAVTTDEVKSILREKDKIYTQLKIDEITNIGAVKIRMRSLFAALEEKE